jgi:hypothetical protein
VKKVTLLVLAILVGVAAFIPGSTTSQPEKGDCVMVLKDSVHGYYSPEFEAGLVGWFVEGNELSLRKVDGEWWLVAGQGIDSGMHRTRMTAWVHRSYMGICE